jgi:glycosyltransferase involved in cell wall biosynthesis
MILALVVASGPRLPRAQALLRALEQHHPALDRRLLLADRRPPQAPPGLAPDALLAADDLAVAGLARLAFELEPAALAQALLPHAIRRCFALPGCEAVIALDADSDLHAPLAPLLRALREGCEAVLLPRDLLRDTTVERAAAERELLRGGVYDPGCLALRNSPGGRRLLDWWLGAAAGDPEEQALHLEGRWLDLVPAYCDTARILRHPGLGVTPANAAARGLRRDGDAWRVGAEELILARFPAGALATGTAGAELLALWEERVALAAVGAPAQRYAFDYTTTGLRIPPLLRRYYAGALEPLGLDPFTPTAAWFTLPAIDLMLEPAESFSRFAQFLHDEPGSRAPRLDLRQPVARRHLIDWLRDGGLEDAGFVGPLRDLVLRGLRSAGGETDAAQRPLGLHLPTQASLGERLVGAVWRRRALYRLVPGGLRRPLRQLLLRLTRTRTSLLVGDASTAPARYESPARSKPDPALPRGAVLLGYPEAELGLGQALRGLALGLLETGVPLRLANFSSHIVAHPQRDRTLSHLIDNQATARAQVFCINADQLPAGLAEIGRQRVAAAYDIAYPFWELPRLPAVWVPNFAPIDEVWAPSRFVQAALAAALDKPVIHMGVGVQLPRARPLRRRDFGIAEDRYAFLFFFDYTSYASRKNPEAVLEAFHRAFPPGSPAPVTLVLKSMGLELESGRREHLAELAARDPRIRLIDRALEPGEQAALLASVDALVSLHRSEGFGLGMAEALLLGKPVVATAYGGCMDFLAPDNACLVDYRLVTVGAGQYPHGEGQVWADPDLDQAAHYLRRLVAEPAWGQAQAARGQQEVRTNHSPAAIGRRAAQRLRGLGLIA